MSLCICILLYLVYDEYINLQNAIFYALKTTPRMATRTPVPQRGGAKSSGRVYISRAKRVKKCFAESNSRASKNHDFLKQMSKIKIFTLQRRSALRVCRGPWEEGVATECSDSLELAVTQATKLSTCATIGSIYRDRCAMRIVLHTCIPPAHLIAVREAW